MISPPPPRPWTPSLPHPQPNGPSPPSPLASPPSYRIPSLPSAHSPAFFPPLPFPPEPNARQSHGPVTPLHGLLRPPNHGSAPEQNWHFPPFPQPHNGLVNPSLPSLASFRHSFAILWAELLLEPGKEKSPFTHGKNEFPPSKWRRRRTRNLQRAFR